MANILRIKKIEQTEKLLAENKFQFNRDCGVVSQTDENGKKKPVLVLMVDAGNKELKYFQNKESFVSPELADQLAVTLAKELAFQKVTVRTDNETAPDLTTLGYQNAGVKKYQKTLIN